MMTIAFTCGRCATRFRVSDRLAGKKARCKKCGQQLLVPRAPPTATSVAATGLFRMGAVPADSVPADSVPGDAVPAEPPSGPTEQAASKSPHQPAPAPRRPTPPPSLRLAPIPSQDNLKPVARNQDLIDEEEAGYDPLDYELPPLAATPPARATANAPARSPAKRPGQPPPPRRRWVWGQGGIAETALIALRKISDLAYLISVPFLLLVLLAIVMKQREWAIFAAVCVVLLNVVRLGLDGFVLVTLAFKHGPLQGVLFFIPPFTFHYLSKRGQVMKDALTRFLGPAVPIAAVVLLAIFVPVLRGDTENPDAPLSDRLKTRLGTLQEKITTDQPPPQDAPPQDSQNQP